jgi:RNA polymerase sigma-70 factor (ECF subfamily)
MNFGKTIAITEQDLSEVAGMAAQTEFEKDFLERLKAGENEAFDNLINEYSTHLYALLLRLTDNSEEARDLTQETFLRVVQSIENFRGESSLKTWLFRIAINQARNRRRWSIGRFVNQTFSLDARRGGEDENTQNWHEILRDEKQITPEEEVLRREQTAQINKALQQIPPVFREAVILRDIENLSYEEIAAALETNVGTVKSRISRGREVLRKKLKRSLII